MADVWQDSTRPSGRVWPVGALCRAVADALEARFNPVLVAGEISGFSRASSGHCYFSLKDDHGQLRCAMFRRAAGLLSFSPRDGDQVELRGRLGVYEPRGELQLVVESMTRAGAGTLFEQFLRLKERLEKEGLFDASRKRPLPDMPRGIGLVTSLGAAALHDVVTALQRRVPHIPVLLAPAAVQGADAPAEIARALQSLYRQAQAGDAQAPVDVILLVRGGGSLEDLWAFNDETLARTIAVSPVPVISGVGHETDFTMADFVADVRAPTPTAAAELVSRTRQQYLVDLDQLSDRLQRGIQRAWDRQAQAVDRLAERVSRPSVLVARQDARLQSLAQQLQGRAAQQIYLRRRNLQDRAQQLPRQMERALTQQRHQQAQLGLRLQALDPHQVLERGFAWITGDDGLPLTRAAQFQPGATVVATLADGTVDLSVTARPGN